MNMLFTLHKNGFSLQIVLKLIKKKKKKKKRKKKRILLFQFYYKAKIKVLFSFSHFVKLLFCIFLFLGRKMATSFLAAEI